MLLVHRAGCPVFGQVNPTTKSPPTYEMHCGLHVALLETLRIQIPHFAYKEIEDPSKVKLSSVRPMREHSVENASLAWADLGVIPNIPYGPCASSAVKSVDAGHECRVCDRHQMSFHLLITGPVEGDKPAVLFAISF